MWHVSYQVMFLFITTFVDVHCQKLKKKHAIFTKCLRIVDLPLISFVECQSFLNSAMNFFTSPKTIPYTLNFASLPSLKFFH